MPGKPTAPELRKFMDKQVCIQLNGRRTVSGVLRGYDVFLNIVLDEALEHIGDPAQPDKVTKENIGQVVIRGNSVVMMEALQRI